MESRATYIEFKGHRVPLRYEIKSLRFKDVSKIIKDDYDDFCEVRMAFLCLNLQKPHCWMNIQKEGCRNP